MPLDLSPDYIEAIKRFEGFAPKASWDYKQHTNGYGTKALYPGEEIDQGTAQQRLETELSNSAQEVNKIAPDAPEGVKAALTSLTFNAGSGWMNSGLGQAVKAGDWDRAQTLFQQYNKAGGDVLPGLVARRQEEASWFGGPPTQVATDASGEPAAAAGPKLPLDTGTPATPTQSGGLLSNLFGQKDTPSSPMGSLGGLLGSIGDQPQAPTPDPGQQLLGQLQKALAQNPDISQQLNLPPDLSKLQLTLANLPPQIRAYHFSNPFIRGT